MPRRQGNLRPGGTIVEATAGNTGIGLALIGVNRGYRVALFVPEQFSEEKVMIMRALGAEVTRTPEAEGMQGAITRAKELAASDPKAFMAAQFENPANPDYHYETTAARNIRTDGRTIDAIVIGCWNRGHIHGHRAIHEEKLPDVGAYAVETQGSVLGGGQPGPHKVEGIGASFIPKNFDRIGVRRSHDGHRREAFDMVKQLAAREGVLARIQRRAPMFLQRCRVAQKSRAGKRVVTMIPDSAERYLVEEDF